MFLNVNKYRRAGAAWLAAGLTLKERAELAQSLLGTLPQSEARQIAHRILPMKQIIRDVHLYAAEIRGQERQPDADAAGLVGETNRLLGDERFALPPAVRR